MTSDLGFRFVRWMARVFGSWVRNEATGEKIGKALIFPWRGRVYVLGLEKELRPVPARTETIRYWRQSIGFALHDPVATERSRAAQSLQHDAERVVLVLLDHREPVQVEATIAKWTIRGVAVENILLVYGGDSTSFSSIRHPTKEFISDSRLRTIDHQRERQSYRGLMAHVSRRIRDRDVSHILFCEYDQQPLVTDPLQRYLKASRGLDADLMGQKLVRVDGTTHHHWLDCYSEIPSDLPVFSMLGTGHFWTREAWDATSADTRLGHLYFELDFPTTAARLGFRIVGLESQDPFVVSRPEHLETSPRMAKGHGAWTIHPVKRG